jgi:hypothetical protein
MKEKEKKKEEARMLSWWRNQTAIGGVTIYVA